MQSLTFNKALIIALAAAAFAALVVAMQVPSLVGALLTPSLDRDATAANLGFVMVEHEVDRDTYKSRFNGRSLFFKPKPPPRPRPVVQLTETSTKPDIVETEPAPVISKDYGGPTILFVLGDEIWFKNGAKLLVGEEDNGLKVLSSDPPWSVRIGYGGGEYDVDLFKRTYPGLDDTPQARRAPPGLVIIEPSESQ